MVLGRINSVFAKHHRWLFGGIVLVIIVTFVFYFSTGSIFDILRFGGGSATGVEVFGKGVSEEELVTQMKCTLVRVAMQWGTDALRSDEVYNYAHNAAPYSLGLLKVAEDRGINASSGEVDDALIAAFSVGGKFNEEALNRFSEALAQSGITNADIKESVRRMMIVDRLENELGASALFAGTENMAQTLADSLRGEYTVSVAAFRSDDYLGQTAVTDEEVAGYYDSNPELYTVPATFSAQMAVFPYSDPKLEADARAKALADPAAVRRFYEENIVKYASEGAAPDFSEAAPKVTADFVAATVRELAQARAEAFALEVYDKLDASPAPSVELFLNAARNGEVPVKQTAEYGAQSVQIAFADGSSVIADPQLPLYFGSVSSRVPLSDVYSGSDGAYVGYITELAPPSIRPLAEVRGDIVETLRRDQALTAARAAAGEKAETLAVLSGEADRLAAFELLGNLSEHRYTASEVVTAPEDMAAMSAAFVLPVGGVSGAMAVPDGAIVVRLDKVEVGAASTEAFDGRIQAIAGVDAAVRSFMESYLAQNVRVSENYMRGRE